MRSPWVERELAIAIQIELTEKRKVLLPIRLDESKVPIFLTGKLYADFSSPERYYTELGKLLDALGSKQKPGPSIVADTIVPFVGQGVKGPVHDVASMESRKC